MSRSLEAELLGIILISDLTRDFILLYYLFVLIEQSKHQIYKTTNVCFFIVSAYGKVFLVRKRCGIDEGKLYAMKVLKKASIVQKLKTAEHTRTERQVN